MWPEYEEFFKAHKYPNDKSMCEINSKFERLKEFALKYCDTTYGRLGFIEFYDNKMVLRVFALRCKYDGRRKLENRTSFTKMEILTAIEGVDYALAYSAIVSSFMGRQLSYYFDDEKYKRSGYLLYCPDYIHHHYGTNADVFDGYYTRCWSIEDIIKMRPDLKYSQMTMDDNPILYAKKYSECNGIEMLRKCGFRNLMNNKNCIKRLNKGDKHFMKLLYQMHQRKCTGYSYNFYANFYNKYKLDMTKLDYHIFEDRVKGQLFAYRNQFRYCWSNGIQIAFDAKEICKYLFKQKEEFSYYKDYLEMCLKVGHDIEDQYWRYPNNLSKAHNKVMKELENVKKLQSHLRYDYLNEVLKDLKQYNITSSNGYDVFVTGDMNIIQKQCDVLYQCLIRNDYVMKEVMQEIILVFLWKDGNPIATAEVHYDGSVGQFYGDERDRQKCLATPEMWDALNEWLEQVKLVKRSCDTKLKYYKGFHKKTEDGRFYTSFGDTYFEIGKVYETPFDDEFIISEGGNRCVASNKVFHFCDSIEEISRHYNPTCYCIVEPLGPVLECNGALLTNRLKIVQEIQTVNLI